MTAAVEAVRGGGPGHPGRPAGHDRTSMVSVDVFDTTLTRSCGPPEGVYLWLGRRLARAGVIEQTPEVFARVRMRVEQEVWRRAGGMDAHVSLEDFHRELAAALLLDPDRVPALVAAELALEEEVLVPVPAARRLVAEARDAGQDVVFVTDTYFPRAWVERRLAAAGVLAPGTPCFASNERARSKASGLLFDTVLSETGREPGGVLHVGDNPYADVAVPRSRGLRTRWFSPGRLNRHERLLAEHMWETGGLAAALAGASRQARLHAPEPSPDRRAIRDVAAGVAAPVLVAYVLWVLHRAADAGLDRLYFLSRDGQVLADVARRLVPRLGLPVEIRYLYASRLATNLAATYEASDEELAWVLRDRGELPPEGMLGRLGISWDEVADELAARGVRPGGQATPPEVAERVVAALQAGRPRRLLLERAAASRAVVRDYLAQEGVLDGGRHGIVDFGGVGSQVRGLHALVRDAGAPAPAIFLVGLDRLEDAGLPPTGGEPAWLRDTACWLYDHRRGRGIERFRGFGTLVQMFCAAGHDTVTGYRREGERVVPVLGGGTAARVRAWGLDTLRSAVAAVAEALVLDDDLVDVRADLRGAACAVVRALWEAPTSEEARAWGAFPFEGAQASAGTAHLLAAPYSWPSAAAGVLQRTFPDLSWQHWHEASVRLSPPSLRWALRAAATAYWRLETTRHPWGQAASATVRRALGRGRR